jgi:hypothetical protein
VLFLRLPALRRLDNPPETHLGPIPHQIADLDPDLLYPLHSLRTFSLECKNGIQMLFPLLLRLGKGFGIAEAII